IVLKRLPADAVKRSERAGLAPIEKEHLRSYCRSLSAQFIKRFIDFTNDLFGPLFRADGLAQIGHEMQCLRDVSVDVWKHADSNRLQPLLQYVLRAVGDDQIRLHRDNLFDIRIDQPTYTCFPFHFQGERVEIAYADDLVAESKSEERFSDARNHGNDALRWARLRQ